MKIILILLLLFSASAIAQQAQRPSDEEIDARMQVFSAKLTEANNVEVVLRARIAIVERENAKLREDATKTKPTTEAPKK